MSVLSLRTLLADHANSLDQLLRDRGISRPASLLTLAGHRGFCGFPDLPVGAGLRATAYTLKGNRRKQPLTWGVVAGAPAPGNVNLRTAAIAAVSAWQLAVPGLNFSEAPNASLADIKLAWATPNQLVPGSIGLENDSAPVQVLFSNAGSWRQNNATPGGNNSLLAVVAHELGHALGLLHSTSDLSIMNAFNTNLEVPAPDDANGLRALYGWGLPAGTNPIPDRGSDRGPALCACGPVLAMAWKGIADDHRIFFASSVDGLNWSVPKIVNGVGTSDTPSLAWDGTQLWMAWKGTPGDSGLFFARTPDPRAWPDNPGALQIQNVGSSNGPAIAMVPGPMLAWKGIEGDSGIFFSTFGTSWLPQQKIAGVGTSDRPALIADVTGRPLLVWKGIEGDSGLFASTMLGSVASANFWQPQQPVSWVIPGNLSATAQGIGFPGAKFGPGISTDGSRIFMAWRGLGDDQGIWFTQRATDTVGGTPVVEWSSQGNIPNVGTSDRPAAAFFAGRLFLAWKGIEGDQRIFLGRL